MEIYSLVNSITIDKPSLFELLSLESLQSLLKPALLNCSSALVQRYPRSFLFLHLHFDSIYTLLHALVEIYHLHEWKSSFCEHFYGLKRTRNIYTPLSRSQFLKSILVLVLVPAIQDYFKQLYTRFNTVFTHFSIDKHASVYQKISLFTKLIFVKLYPVIQTIDTLVRFVYYARYLHNHSLYYSPLQQFTQTVLSRLVMNDYKDYQDLQFSAKQKRMLKLKTGSIKDIVLIYTKIIGSNALEFLKTALPLALLVYQFADGWYSSDAYKKLKIEPIPKPPEPFDVPLDFKPEICHICKKNIVNPTMIYTGFVFCYPCIHEHVLALGTCPITSKNVALDSLRRLFDL
jgi:peroxin-12